ncbi:MAG: hypothetical protein WDW38_005014 [Sanguina aurantia]
MGRHQLPAIANRLRVNRGFDSAWYSDCSYATMLQKDWMLSKTVSSFVNRSSRSLPRVGAKEEQAKLAAAGAAALPGAAVPTPVPAKGAKPQAVQEVKDFPNLRTSRIFMQHLPYKSVASVFAYAIPKEGPQSKYGLFQPRKVFEVRKPAGQGR